MKIIPAYLCCGCSGLTSVTIGTSVTTIGKYAFSGCSRLTSVTIPESVTMIEGHAFSGCSGVNSVIFNAKNYVGYCFTSEYAPFMGLSNAQIFVIGEGVTRLPIYLCAGMSSITSVTIPNSVTSIGKYAFYYCSSLAKVSLPTSIETLGSALFSSTLRDLYVHWDDPITISEDVFEYCYKNTILHVPEGAEKYYRARQGWKNFETIWEDAETDGVTVVHIDQDPDAAVNVLNLNGQLIRKDVKFSEVLHGLPSGIYIVGGRKVVVP